MSHGSKSTTGKIGAIVMNCNPLTNGHLYLIEYAARHVDFLYLFVVEENRSFFDFSDRYELVKQGTEFLQNVMVVPSGKFILSYQTLPVYFEKEQVYQVDVDASADLDIFARYIAPPLGITYRFAGEEPFDEVTRQYNQQMKMVLGEYGIEFVEVPRKAIEGQPIGASMVRKLLNENRLEEIQKLVPDVTFQYLKNRNI
jgi:[citrate (pro-3S)-lyase] ligase